VPSAPLVFTNPFEVRLESLVIFARGKIDEIVVEVDVSHPTVGDVEEMRRSGDPAPPPDNQPYCGIDTRPVPPCGTLTPPGV